MPYVLRGPGCQGEGFVAGKPVEVSVPVGEVRRFDDSALLDREGVSSWLNRQAWHPDPPAGVAVVEGSVISAPGRWGHAPEVGRWWAGARGTRWSVVEGATATLPEPAGLSTALPLVLRSDLRCGPREIKVPVNVEVFFFLSLDRETSGRYVCFEHLFALGGES